MFAALVVLLMLGSARAQSGPEYKGADLYRSKLVTVERIEKALAVPLRNYLRLRADGRRSAVANAEKLKPQIEAGIRKLGPIAFARLNYSEYYSSAERTAYLTFDVVDQADAKERMPFEPAPSGKAADPGGLLAAWQQYGELGRELTRQGLLASTDKPTCPALYCPYNSSGNAELSAFEARFAEGVPKHSSALRAAARTDADARARAAALYLISYSSDAAAAVEFLQSRLADPSEDARAAALQVLADVALYRKGQFVDAARLIPALDFPTVSDRGKAMSVIVGLIDNPTYKTYIAARAGPYLLELLKLKNPANHDLAYTLLSVLSQENHDRRDYAAWTKWVEAHAPPKAPAPW